MWEKGHEEYYRILEEGSYPWVLPEFLYWGEGRVRKFAYKFA
jgi:hypothetical protein